MGLSSFVNMTSGGINKVEKEMDKEKPKKKDKDTFPQRNREEKNKRVA